MVTSWHSGRTMAVSRCMPLRVYTLYGQAGKHLSPDMRRVADTVTRLGAPAIPGFFRDLAWWAVRRPLVVAGILAGIPWRRWSCLEVAGENVWAMKRASDPACPEYGLTRTALRASGRSDILLFLLVSTIASTAGLQAWQTLINNFAVESAHLSADGIGFVQSIRELPGFLSMRIKATPNGCI